MKTNLRIQSRAVSVNSADPAAAAQLRDAFLACLGAHADRRELVLLCIGTDRATGDSLGPLAGYKLAARAKASPHAAVTVYGTLEAPVHAQNLRESLAAIRQTHNDPLIVAIDACLGKSTRVGWLTVSQGPVRPGAAMRKPLPDVGDISVMGVVNLCGMQGAPPSAPVMELFVLQNTRLYTVMRMADIIADGLSAALGLPGAYSTGS